MSIYFREKEKKFTMRRDNDTPLSTRSPAVVEIPNTLLPPWYPPV